MTVAMLIEVVGIFGAVMTLAASLIWVERRLLGQFQERLGPNRVGPLGTLQPVADVVKLMGKDDWIPPFADRPIFLLAPLILSVTALLSFAVVPISPGLGIVDLDVGLLFVLAVWSLGIYGTLLGGWASASKYSLLGGLRAASQSLSYEVFLGLSAASVVVLAGSFDLRTIVLAQDPVWYVVYQPVGAVLFFLGGVALAHRIPFDLPEGETELVAGYHAEYAGLKFGMFFVGEYLVMVVVSALTTVLFLGGWLGPVLPPVLWFFLKTFALICLIILLRGALPRPRFDQLLRWSWAIWLPLALLNLVITGAVVIALS